MKKLQILLVEDNEGDIWLTSEALESMGIEKEIIVLKTGKEAVDYLTQSGPYPDAKAPDLILMDINLPVKNGFEVLSVIKADEKTKRIPVIILTTSSSKKDKELAESLKVELFITKPTEMLEYEIVVETIEKFWHTFNQRQI